jgi:hypothetical protein
MAKQKFCVDCTNCRSQTDAKSYTTGLMECTAEAYDLVTGEKVTARPCNIMRKNEDYCGERGRWYDPKSIQKEHNTKEFTGDYALRTREYKGNLEIGYNITNPESGIPTFHMLGYIDAQGYGHILTLEKWITNRKIWVEKGKKLCISPIKWRGKYYKISKRSILTNDKDDCLYSFDTCRFCEYCHDNNIITYEDNATPVNI